jgi:hypothetical protein
MTEDNGELREADKNERGPSRAARPPGGYTSGISLARLILSDGLMRSKANGRTFLDRIQTLKLIRSKILIKRGLHQSNHVNLISLSHHTPDRD